MTAGFSQKSPPSPKRNKTITGLLVALGVLLVILPIVVGLYTDWLWFGALDYRGVFINEYIARIVMFLLYGIVAGLIIFAACFFTWKGRPQEDFFADLNSPVHQYRQQIAASVRTILVALPAIIGLIAGVLGQAQWRQALQFVNSTEFGVSDPQFGRDYSFYAFQLPLINSVVGTLSMLLIVAFLIALVGHYLIGNIHIANQATGASGHIASAARVQLAVTAGLWMLVQAAQYWLDRYGLLYTAESDGLFTGASYTEINATLPAKIILTVIALVVAAAFFASVVYKDLRVPGLAVVLMVVSSLVVGAVYPAAVQRFSVQPNRQVKEQEYIARNIEATRFAYGLTDDEVTYMENWGEEPVSDDEVANDVNTISNIRLLDPEIISPTFTQMQQLRNFYGFPDTLAMDRYEVDGNLRDFVVSVREVDPNALRENQRDWINRHTVYTHGNGFVAAQANTVDEAPQEAGSTRGGFPVFTVSDLQTNAAQAEEDAAAREEAEDLGIVVDQPRVYYGPVIASANDGADYAIVGNDGDADFEYDTDNTQYTYTGEGGVNLGNPINRLAYAAQYQELNFLLSERVTSESKILYNRDPRERVEAVAPWLTTDSATYPAVIDGRIKWIVDGYTTLSALPYSERETLTDVTQDANNPTGTDQRLITDQVGYIRNSVKAVVDAYDGTVELYEFDTEDPVLQTWMKAFPDTVNPRSEITPELEEHLRYPEDMFKVQRNVLARYHVDDPNVFFNNDAFWSIPSDPTAADSPNAESNPLPQPPHYVMATDPQNPDEASFQLITPFRGLQREFLAAHMTASSNPENYGEITVRVLPTDTQTQGPRQAQDAMMSSDQVARDRTLWQGTNTLYNGNLLTLPVGGGEILYVEPIYSERAEQASAFPKLLRVLVSYKGRVGYAPTIAQALAQVGIEPSAAQEIDGEGRVVVDEDSKAEASEDSDAEQPAESSTPDGQAATASGAAGDAIGRINDALNALEAARGGTHEEYGAALDELDAAVQAYRNTQ